jgi:hypothetical protein
VAFLITTADVFVGGIAKLLSLGERSLPTDRFWLYPTTEAGYPISRSCFARCGIPQDRPQAPRGL